MPCLRRAVHEPPLRSIGISGSRPISRVLSRTIIHLGCLSPDTSSNLPGSSAGHTLRHHFAVVRLPPYLVLLRVGFAVPSRVTTDAVRSYRTLSPLPVTLARDLGGLLSVALSVGSRLPGVTWHSAQWSPDFPPLASCEVCSDCLADSRRAWCRDHIQQASTSLNSQKARHRTM